MHLFDKLCIRVPTYRFIVEGKLLYSRPSKSHFYNTQCFFLRRRKIFVTVSSRQPLNSYRSSTKRLTCTINIILLRSLGYTLKRIIFFITNIIENNYTSDGMKTYKSGHSYSYPKYLTVFS